MNNKLKPEEMFVIIPSRYADNLVKILAATPDVKGLYEATRPAESPYWEKQRAKEARAEKRQGGDGTEKAIQLGLKISMDWEDEGLEMIAAAPKMTAKGPFSKRASTDGKDGMNMVLEVVKWLLVSKVF